jgi:hypothetical protein
VLIDVELEGAQSGPRFDKTVGAELAEGCTELALKLPEKIVDGDMQPIPAPWQLIVADAEAWPARLLAARIATLEGDD